MAINRGKLNSSSNSYQTSSLVNKKANLKDPRNKISDIIDKLYFKKLPTSDATYDDVVRRNIGSSVNSPSNDDSSDRSMRIETCSDVSCENVNILEGHDITEK